jgi:mono/diheme cytochrome c family protein
LANSIWCGGFPTHVRDDYCGRGALADLSDPALIAAGQKRFNQACFYCHGQDGVGGKGASLRNRPDLAPQFIFDSISNGRIRGSSVMPKWKNGLSEDQIWELTAFIVSLKDAK